MSPPRAKVVVLCDRLDLAGGVERFACELASDLALNGFDAVLASVATPRAAIRFPLDARVRVVHGADTRPLPAGDGVLAVLRRQSRIGSTLAGVLAHERPAAVVMNGLTTACSVLMLLRGRAPALVGRSIVCDHNHFRARSRPWQRLRAMLYPRVAALVSLTEADRPAFAALNPRTVVIPNAAALRAEAPPPAVRERAAPRVLAIGRHVAQKGFDRLLAAWPAVQAAVPGARLRIVGSGPLEAELHAQAAALGLTVDWAAPHADMAAEYRAAALFVLPSRYEGMPLVLLEAQAMGLPAVAFDCPTGPADVLTPETGCLVPDGDGPALAAALVELLRDPERRARMGRAAIARAKTVFAPQKTRAAWRALVQEIADAR